MENSDRLFNLQLSRRQALAMFRAAGAATVAVACSPRQFGTARTASISTPTSSSATTGALPGCVVSPQQTEGPYFVNEHLNRSDIRSDPADGSVKAGVPLQLRLNVSQVGSTSCTPLVGAIVDVWHCDALGVYSDVQDRSFDTRGEKFLRGYQVTDNNGAVQFTTIYPGGYQGRTVHIHFKVRTDATSQQGYEFTSQLYFDDAITAQVYTQQPYVSKGQRTLKNAQDGIFQRGGNQLLLALKKVSQGYAGAFDIGLQV